MRNVLILIFLTALQTFAIDSYSQNTVLSLDKSQVSVKNVLHEIENNSEFYFLYNSKLVNDTRIVDAQFNGKKIDEILAHLFTETGVDYFVIDRQIILSPKEYLAEAKTKLQSTTITGTVTDENGEPIPGGNITIKGTAIGSITNLEGKYSIEVRDPSTAILVFSYIGYHTQEIAVENQTEINVSMQLDILGLEEVVVIGYGTQRKVDLTGSIASTSGDILAERNTTQMSQALQGTMSGVMVTRNNNAPGSTASIRIRGITTIGNSTPLIIVDGVPVDNINDVNPQDVENISVLKDAASASIYGSRAAAGVILVTTKRAKPGQLNMTYNAEFGFEQPTEWPEYVDVVRFMEFDNEQRWNDNDNTGTEYATYSEDLINNYMTLNAEDPNLYPNTDWYGLIMKDRAPRSSHLLSISAGTQAIATKISLAFDKTEGLYDPKSYERLTARINNDVTINNYLSASVDLFYKRSTANDASINPIYSMHIAAPVYAAEWTDGRVAPGKAGHNSYGQVKYGGYRNDWYNTIGGRASIDFTPLEGLKLSAIVAPSFGFDKGKDWLKAVETTAWEDPTGSAGTLEWASSTGLYESRYDNYRITTQFLANYMKSFGDHNLNLMGGYEYFYAFNESLGASRNQYILTSFPYLNLGPLEYRNNSGSAWENAYRSWFGRVMYNYKSKYLFQANIRYDGSSRFHADYRWGTFPSFSAGWVVSKESFMEGISQLSFLKLRASWGSLGNERIGNYPYQSTIAFSNAMFFQGSNVVSAQTAAQTRYAIQDISWETTESLDFGINAGFLNNRLSLTYDYYVKTTRDMLLALEIPDFMGYDNPNQNTGIMDTKGWDADINWRDQVGDLHYSVSFNISDFKSVMGDLGGTEFLGSQIKIEGSEFNEWYGYQSDGLFQTQEEVDNSAVTSAAIRAGDVKYVDISGPEGIPDGNISPEYDRVLLGGSLPRYMYGGNIRLDYKGFDFSLIIQGVGKQNSRISSLMVMPLQENWGNAPAIYDGKYFSHYNTPEQNAGAEYPRLSWATRGNNYGMSDYWMFNGRYFRIKNITLGYTLPADLTQKANIKNIRLYASVSDLLSLNQYPEGWDPEVAGSGYPITRSWVFGLSVNF